MNDMVRLTLEQSIETQDALRRNGVTLAQFKKMTSGDCFKQFARVVDGHAVIVDREQFGHIKALAEAMAPRSETTEPTADTLIRIDRAASLTYPDWMKEVMHPELEHTGPAEYDLTKVEQWLHDGQKNGKTMCGNAIYEHLKSND
ncbi:MAG TPA: hypothetical protein VF803_00075, partial [Candidatus Paceibacterota bacterium]